MRTRALVLAILWVCSSAAAEVTVHTGPTYIPRGDAQGERDITVNNGDSVLFSGRQQTNEDNSVRDLTGRLDLEWILSSSHKLDL